MNARKYIRVEGHEDIYEMVLRNPGDTFLSIVNLTDPTYPDLDPRKRKLVIYPITIGSTVRVHADFAGLCVGKIISLDILNAKVEIRLDQPEDDGSEKGVELVVIRTLVRNLV